MLADDLKRIDTELQTHRENVRSLRNMMRFGILVDAQNAALLIAREIHGTARALESSGNQLELLPPEKGEAQR